MTEHRHSFVLQCSRRFLGNEANASEQYERTLSVIHAMMAAMMLNRRSLLRGLPFLPLMARAAETTAPKATITGLEIFHVHVNRRGDWVIPRLQTSAGVTGIGDASHSGNDNRTMQLLRQCIEAMEGRSIYHIEHLREIGMDEFTRSGRDRMCTRLNSSHVALSRMPSSA